MKKNPKKIERHFKIILIFSHVFLSILHNIELYIYTVRYRYKSNIKYLVSPNYFQKQNKIK
jgi:hypothetical protein